jgi:hypothetical protein
MIVARSRKRGCLFGGFAIDVQVRIEVRSWRRWRKHTHQLQEGFWSDAANTLLDLCRERKRAAWGVPGNDVIILSRQNAGSERQGEEEGCSLFPKAPAQ